MKLLVLICGLALVNGYAFHQGAKELKGEGRIVHGKDTHPGQIKYMAKLALRRRSKKRGLCGGSLIANEWVLTAAHCVTLSKLEGISLGTIYLNESAVVYHNPLEIFVHPHFNNITHHNDIALIKIPYTEESENIGIIPLPKIGAPYETYAGSQGLISGWGKTGNNEPFSNILQWVHLPILTNESCKEFEDDLLDGDICVDASSGASTCYGDSGGPLVSVSTGELIGVSSMLPIGGCETGKPPIFIRVTEYLQWIKDVTGVSYEK